MYASFLTGRTTGRCPNCINHLEQVPIVLVGNKIDLRGKDITNESLEEQIMPIMNEFKV